MAIGSNLVDGEPVLLGDDGDLRRLVTLRRTIALSQCMGESVVVCLQAGNKKKRERGRERDEDKRARLGTLLVGS